MTQGEMIIDYLNRNKTITPFEAFEHLHITKLSTRIGELERNKGVKFKRKLLKGENQYGKYEYMQYSLDN